MTPIFFAQLCADAYERPTMEAGGVEALAHAEEGNLIIAFRGSSDAHDWAWNARVIPKWSDRLECFVHRGFLAGAEAIWPQILGLVSGWNGNIYVTGHSKGGAEATLIAAFLCAAWRPPAGLVTFGAPRVGFGGLSDVLSSVPGQRFVNGADAVPSVPWWPYQHNRPSTDIGEPAELFNGEIDPVTDHDIKSYITTLSG